MNDIRKQISKLDTEMLARRQALNEEHYYPKLEKIRAECASMGHGKTHIKRGGIFSNRLDQTCNDCGATIETKWESLSDEEITLNQDLGLL